MGKYEVIYTVTGRARAEIDAESLSEAKEMANELDVIDASCELIEWEFDEVEQVRKEDEDL